MSKALKSIEKYVKFYEEVKSIQSDIEKLEEDRINLDSRIVAITIENLRNRILSVRQGIYKNKGLQYNIYQYKKHLNQILIIYKLANRLGKREYFSYLFEKEIYNIQQNFVFSDEGLLESIKISLTYKEIKKKISDLQSNVSLKFLI